MRELMLIMSRLRSVLIVFLSIGSSLVAMENSLELRTDAFFPSSNLFRNIYGHVGTDYELEYAIRGKSPWGAWANC